MNILITGCNGLVGSALADLFLERPGVKVYGLSRSVSPKQNDRFVSLKIDLTEPDFERQLPERVDLIFHLAQSEHFRDFPGSVQRIFEVNTTSTLRMLEYARKSGTAKFVYASSGGIYGNSKDEFSEDKPLVMNNNLGFYLTTKLCSEMLVENYSAFFSIDILRLFFVYGKQQKKDMLIPRLIESVKRGLPITLNGQHGIRLNPVYVDDAAKAMAACTGLSGNNRINIAGQEVLSLREIAETIGRLAGREPVFRIEGSEPKDLIADITKMKQLLYAPEISFSGGVGRILA